MFDIGLPELGVILLIALLVFGPSKLSSIGKGLGEAIRGIREGLHDEPSDEKKRDRE